MNEENCQSPVASCERMPVAESAIRGRRRFIRKPSVILLGIVLIAVLTRFVGIGAKSYWYDEFCSLEASTGHGLMHFDVPRQVILSPPPDLTSLKNGEPPWRIWTHMKQDVHPPLYFLALRIWRDFFGSSEFATRSLSALAGIAGLLMIFDVGRLAHGRAAGLWAAAIFAVAGPQILEARDARAYTLVVLLGICAVDSIVRIELFGASVRRLLGLGVSVLAMMLTHYLAVPLVAALGLYLLIRTPRPAKWRAVAVVAGAAILYACVWGPFLWQQRANVGAGEQGFLYEGGWTTFYALKYFAALPIRLIGYPVTKQIENAWPAVMVYFLPLLLFRKNRFLLLWFFWLVGTAFFLAAWDQSRHAHHLSFTRYILLCGPGFYLLFAGILRGWRGWLPHVIPAAAVLFGLISLPATYAQWEWPDWRKSARVIESKTGPNDLVCFASDGKHDWFSGYYMSYAYYSKRKASHVLLLDRPANRALMQKIRTFHDVTVVDVTQRPLDQLLPGLGLIGVRSMRPYFMIYRMTSDAPRSRGSGERSDSR